MLQGRTSEFPTSYPGGAYVFKHDAMSDGLLFAAILASVLFGRSGIRSREKWNKRAGKTELATCIESENMVQFTSHG